MAIIFWSVILAGLLVFSVAHTGGPVSTPGG
jgi:hypothetical protein